MNYKKKIIKTVSHSQDYMLCLYTHDNSQLIKQTPKSFMVWLEESVLLSEAVFKMSQTLINYQQQSIINSRGQQKWVSPKFMTQQVISAKW